MYRDAACRNRAGFTIIEALIVLTVCAMLAAGTAATFVSGSRLARNAADRAEGLATRSIAASVLSWEIRNVEVRRDGFGLTADSMAERIFRGRAIVCSADSVRAEVRYAGLRLPDPTKDSLLVLAGAGAERTRALTAAVSGATTCSAVPGESLFALQPAAGLVPGDVALLFERGSYHLQAAALRYRRGAGGRQPLTPGLLFDDSTDFAIALSSRSMTAPETVGIHLRLSTAGTTPAAVSGPPERLRIPLRNLRLPLDSLLPRP